MAADRERYSIIKRLDKGGMAEVFLARSTSLEGFDKVVAIKRVLPHLAANDRFVNMFLDEAKLSLHLDHTNIVSVFDVGRSGQTYFIVMEYIDGTNMKRLVEGRAMPLDLACYVLIEVCKGLVYAHEKNDNKGQPLHIVHRDVSPPNILISREGEVKLTDFGLARAASQIESTDPGVVKGKFAYLSPEAAVGADVDLRADIFAAGIVLWEAITGRRLFQGATDLETLENVRACRVPSIHSMRADFPASLDRILSRALAKDPADRYGSARDMGRELALFLVEQRLSVTSYDLAAWMQELIDMPTEVSRISPSLAESAVQAELERFVGLDEESIVAPSKGRGAPVVSKSDFEDPRLWGVFDEAGTPTIEDIHEASQNSGVFEPARSGTQKLGRPISEHEAVEALNNTGMFARPSFDGSNTDAGVPPVRPPASFNKKRLPPGAVIPTKGSGARRLPPAAPGRPGPPPLVRGNTQANRTISVPPPLEPPPRAATMMMSPLDESLFESREISAVSRPPTMDSVPPPVASSPKPTPTPLARREAPPVATPGPVGSTSTANFFEAFDEPKQPAASASSPTAANDDATNVKTAKIDSVTRNDTTEDIERMPSASSGSPWLAQLVSLAALVSIIYLGVLILTP